MKNFRFFKTIFGGFIGLLAITIYWSTGYADPLDLKVKVDKDKVTIGDRIRYEIEIEYDDKIEPEPIKIGENLGEFEIKDYKIDEPKKTKTKRWLSHISYILSAYTIGEFTIYPVHVKYKDANGEMHEAVSEEIKIVVEKVKRSPGDKDDIRPLKSPVEIKSGFPVWLVAIFILVIIVCMAVLLYYMRKKTTIEEPISPPRPPEEVAFEELNALKDMRLIEKGLIKEYYIRISDIIRRYIESRYNVCALDRTTWELYREMRNSKRIDRTYIDKIRDFLEECDLVKFAKYIPEEREIEEVYKKAEEIVRLTTEKPAIRQN